MMRIRRIRWPGVRRRLAGLRRRSGTGRVPPALRGMGTWPPRMGPGNSPLTGMGPVHREPPRPACRRRPGSPAASMAKSTGWARLRKIDGWQGRLACRSFGRSAGTSHPTDVVTASFPRSEPGLASPSLIPVARGRQLYQSEIFRTWKAPTNRGTRTAPGRADAPWPLAGPRMMWRRGSPDRWRHE